MQSRIMSLAEAATNVVMSYVVAVLTQLIALPLFGLSATLVQNLGIGLTFSVVSVVRSYVLRRAINPVPG